MPDHFAPLRRLVVLLLAGFLLVATGSCFAPQVSQPTPSASSVETQLVQLAGSAQPAPTATQAMAQARATSAVSLTAIVQPSPTRTKRPAAAASASPRATRRPSATATPRTGSIRATRTPSDGLATVRQSQLPQEAQRTIALIRQGGPFPYDKDGATFGNREGLLPKRPSGYYKEYTVITPGSRDRGARRIVAGQGGELYYTDDHYDSFRRVIS